MSDAESDNPHIPDDYLPAPGGSVPGDSAPRNSGAEATEPENRQLLLVKHGHRYVFRYAPGDEGKVLERLIEMVRDPECDLDWFDAAVLSHQLGQRFSQQLSELRKP